MMRSRKQLLKTERNKLRHKWMLRGTVIMFVIFIIVCGGVIWFHTTGNQQGQGLPSESLHPAESKPVVSTIPKTSQKPTPSVTALTAAGNDPDSVQMAFVGDVLLASGVETLMKQNGYDYPYKDVKNYLQQPDLTIANLETPVTDRGTEQKKEYIYRSSPLALPALAAAGVDLVNLANNHVMDYGEQGLLDTMEYLDRTGIKHIGAGHDANEAFQPVIIEKKGIKIAFLSFSHIVPDNSWKAGVNHPGVADTYNYTLPVKAIEIARTQADLVVVVTHWGVERNDKPEAYQTDLAHRYIDAGADLVVGGHPHVLQGMESYKGKWIAYSLGNFIFTTNNVPETLDTMILNASCTKDRKCTMSAIPIYTKWAKPEKMTEEQSNKLFARISTVSFHAQIKPDGQIVETP
ncbi:MAG: hypothetical protein JWM44_2206 [Bacilli bacterium]|nr:hypothetical protein [Bacilli bacterium]